MLHLLFEEVTSLMSDLRYEKKATAEYISILDGKFSFLNTSDEYQKANLGKIAVNNNAENPFGALPGQLHSSGFLLLQHAGGIAQACINGDFNHGHTALITGKNIVEKKNSNDAMGALHMRPF